MVGAVMVMETLMEEPEATAEPMAVVVPLICVPLTNFKAKALVQAQVPVFLIDQVLVNVLPIVMMVPSGM